MQLVRFTPPREQQIMWGELEGKTVHAITLSSLKRTGLTWPLSSVTMLVPAAPTKIVCVGRNYADHIKELGNLQNDLPTEPGLFLKGPNTLVVHNETVPYPSWSNNFHFEGELGLVMKSRAQKVKAADALNHVLGYTCAIDLTARDKQKADLQWFRAKGSDKFLPFGPHLETNLDPSHLHLQTRVNGETKQDGNTSNMIFPVADVIAYVSEFMTLEPGDIIITGTPEGVGPLKTGDEVTVEIEGIGRLSTKIGPST